MRAAEQAVLDEVDALNYSISGGGSPYSDPVSLVFLQAYDTGVFVAASAGNAGPGLDTTDHREPWTTTVGATTQNRAFETTATVAGSGGASLSLAGTSLTQGITAPKPVVVAPDPYCIGPYTAGAFTGKVVVCKRGGGPGRAEKGYNVLQGSAAGMILYNQTTGVTDLETDNHFLPAIQIQFAQGQALLNFLLANPNATVTWSAGVKVPAQGDVMASFSSRGGPEQLLGVSKPDITAPGVQILAGHSPKHVDVSGGPQGELFQAIAGTSMSSPHIAGAGALIKALHPDWTPGQIKSALMTTAKTAGVVKEDGVTPADAFDFGSGRVDLSKAGNPGLTFDETAANYVALEKELWNANYPSLYVPVMPGLLTVQRTVHSVLNRPSCWFVSVDKPADMNVVVSPIICVKGGGDKTFSIFVDAHNVPLDQVRHATLKLKEGQRQLHFPITIVRKQPVVTLTKTCNPGTFAVGGKTNCTITAGNTGFDAATVNLVDVLPMQLKLVHGSVAGATELGNSLLFKGKLFGAEPPGVAIGSGLSPAGYLPLSLFGVSPELGVGDETILNFDVPPFVYGGETYTTIGMVSDGYLVAGGGTGADIDFINQSLPDPNPPNNVLAPFWTDLDPGAGGALRVASLRNGVNSWLVFDWENVPNWSGGANSFQAWVGLGAVQDISFTYGPALTSGEGGYLTVGAENKYGNRGANYYNDGAGALPTPTTELVVTSVPGTPGETHVITFSAKGVMKGNWQNCAVLKADLFAGTNTACFNGTVTK
jgi:hypothetical protein